MQTGNGRPDTSYPRQHLQRSRRFGDLQVRSSVISTTVRRLRSSRAGYDRRRLSQRPTFCFFYDERLSKRAPVQDSQRCTEAGDARAQQTLHDRLLALENKIRWSASQLTTASDSESRDTRVPGITRRLGGAARARDLAVRGGTRARIASADSCSIPSRQQWSGERA